MASRPRRQREAGDRPAGLRVGGEGGEIVARSRRTAARAEAGFSTAGQEGCAEAADPRIGGIHARLQSRGGWSPPRAVRSRPAGLTVITPTAPAREQLARPVRAGMGLERAGEACRAGAVDHHRDLAAQVQPGEIVMAGLGQVEAVADEDQWRVDPLRRRPAGDPEEDDRPGWRAAERGRQDAGRVHHERCAGRALGEAPLLEMHRLEEGAVLARGLEPQRGEALRDQVGGAAMAGTAGLAALHIVGGKGRDGGPPGAGAFGLRRGRLGDGGGRDTPAASRARNSTALFIRNSNRDQCLPSLRGASDEAIQFCMRAALDCFAPLQ